MKKLFLALSILLLCSEICFAETTVPQQNAEDNKAVISIQKQPAHKQQNQGVTRNIGCIIIQVNGKVKENDTNSK